MEVISVSNSNFGMANVSKPVKAIIKSAKACAANNPAVRKQLEHDLMIIQNAMPDAKVHMRELYPTGYYDFCLDFLGSLFGLPTRAKNIIVNDKSKAVITGIPSKGIKPTEEVRLLAKALLNMHVEEKMKIS